LLLILTNCTGKNDVRHILQWFATLFYNSLKSHSNGFANKKIDLNTCSKIMQKLEFALHYSCPWAIHLAKRRVNKCIAQLLNYTLSCQLVTPNQCILHLHSLAQKLWRLNRFSIYLMKRFFWGKKMITYEHQIEKQFYSKSVE
jgi:hypothetical protein